MAMSEGKPHDLQLHDVTARRGADKPGADRHLLLVERADVPGVLVVVDNLTKKPQKQNKTTTPPGAERGGGGLGKPTVRIDLSTS